MFIILMTGILGIALIFDAWECERVVLLWMLMHWKQLSIKQFKLLE
jgi:hypothetical protein